MIGLACLGIAAAIFFALGFDIVQSTGKLGLHEIAWGLIALGIAFLALYGTNFNNPFAKKE